MCSGKLNMSARREAVRSGIYKVGSLYSLCPLQTVRFHIPSLWAVWSRDQQSVPTESKTSRYLDFSFVFCLSLFLVLDSPMLGKLFTTKSCS